MSGSDIGGRLRALFTKNVNDSSADERFKKISASDYRESRNSLEYNVPTWFERVNDTK